MTGSRASHLIAEPDSEASRPFEAMVEAAPCGLLLASEQGEIAYVNRTLEDLLGYRREELLGRSLELLLPERYRAAHWAQRAAFAAASLPRLMGAGRDLTALHKDGFEVLVEIGLTPIEWNGRRMIAAAIADITLRKKMELDLRQLNRQLEEFAYVVSHDLKAPLQGISSLVDWIGDDLDGPDQQAVKDNLKRMQDRIDRMGRLIDNLLSYACAEPTAADLTLSDPAELIASILELQPPPDGFEVIVRSAVEPFMAAKTPIETVLRNLVSNAFKHHGGKRGRIEITVEPDGSDCIFTVSDDGAGVPAQAGERVFLLGHGLSSGESAGSGLGLAISKRLVDVHGGRIELVPAEPGLGATFRVRWPRNPPQEIDGAEKL